jgi:hypothetical protein
MSKQAKGYPHRQPFNVKAKPNKRRNSWYRKGASKEISKETYKETDE